MTTKSQKAQATLADPNFDVEGFVRNINIHYQNKQIVRALGSNAQIVLGLVQAGEHRFLEIMPEFINPEIFKEMCDDGCSVYQKSEEKKYRNTSYWFGVKVNDELALWFRRIGYQRTSNNEFKVFRGAEAVEPLVKKWRKRGLRPVGETREDKPPLPVYQIRRDLWDWAHSNLNLKKGWAYRHPTHSEFYWDYYSGSRGNRYSYGSKDYHRLGFTVLQAGKDHVRVKVSCPSAEALVPHNATSKKHKWSNTSTVSFGKKFKIDEPNLCLKIMTWAMKATKQNSDFEKKATDIQTKMAKLRTEAGI
jgi:hypothetical protein